MRNRYVLLLDLPVIALAATGAFILRFDWLSPSSRAEFLPFLLAALLIKPPVFQAFGLYRRYWSYASAADLVAVFVGVTAASVALGLTVGVAMLTRTVVEFSRSVVLIDWLLTLAGAGGLRFSIRLLSDRRLEASGAAGQVKPVLVIGAGTAGTVVLRELRRNPGLGLHPVGLLDDDPVKRGKRIHGVRVIGPLSELSAAIDSYGVQEAIIAMPTASGAMIRRIAQDCAAAGVTSRTIPGIFELLDGRVSVSRLREVEISDLLRRPEVSGVGDAGAYARGRTVLVTGAGGSIGLELCRQVAHAGPSRLVLLGHGENSVYEAEQQLRAAFPNVSLATAIADVRDRDRVFQIFREFRPDVVFHAAAHKHVPLMERNPQEAVTNNVLGTSHVVAAAIATGTARFVQISTDKAVEPRSVMGATKRVAEQVVMQAAARSGRAFAVVRFGNVLGSRGSVVPHFKRQIAAGGPVTITHPDMTRFFMTIPEAVHLVLQAGGMAQGGELFVLDMGEPVRITQLAEDIIALSGYSRDEIEIVYTGLRPGEKLEERLWEHGATVGATQHRDILRVVEPGSDATPQVPLDRLADAARRGDRLEMEMLLAEQVPTYVPSSDAVPPSIT